MKIKTRKADFAHGLKEVQGKNIMRIGLLGYQGRMGKCVRAVLDSEFLSEIELYAPIGSEDAMDPLFVVDLIIDFSHPDAVSKVARAFLDRTGSIPLFVIGSTGWNENTLKVLNALAQRTRVFRSANFSVGVALLSAILKKMAPTLKKYAYTPRMIEVHHQNKKDVPSGTALALEKNLDPFMSEEIPIYSVRAGEVIGNHEITFYGRGDQLCVSHHAQDRKIFARGALSVAVWLMQEHHKNPSLKGYLDMEDYLNVK